MTATYVIAARQRQALTALTAILERHDPEAAARLAKTNHGSGIPGSIAGRPWPAWAAARRSSWVRE